MFFVFKMIFYICMSGFNLLILTFIYMKYLFILTYNNKLYITEMLEKYFAKFRYIIKNRSTLISSSKGI